MKHRKDLIMKRKGEARNLMGHKKKFQKRIYLNDTKKYSFPQKSIYPWNGLKKEVIMSKNVQQLKEKLDKYRYGNGTTQM